MVEDFPIENHLPKNFDRYAFMRSFDVPDEAVDCLIEHICRLRNDRELMPYHIQKVAECKKFIEKFQHYVELRHPNRSDDEISLYLHLVFDEIQQGITQYNDEKGW